MHPGAWYARLWVTTMFFRPGKGLPIDSYVRLPMMIGCPMVTRLK
jgi:hypothetical protein